MTNRIKSYINQFTQILNKNPWLDETFAKKLDYLTESQAFTQAPGNNHSVAEVVAHLTEWRIEVVRRLEDNSQERRLTDESPQNWQSLSELQQLGWEQLYANFKENYMQFLEFLESKDDNFLDGRMAETEFDKEYFVAGLLHHDLYHLGQIGLILKWVK